MKGKDRKINIFYIGLHENTSLILDKGGIDILGINYLDIFGLSINPVDDLFFLIYFLVGKNRFHSFQVILFSLWKRISFLSSPYFQRYSGYLELILKKRIPVIDIDNIKDVIGFFKTNSIDFIVVNSWSILPKEIFLLPKYATVNIHPSKLPKNKGALPTLWSLKNKDTESAVTYLILNESIDGGDILSQHDFRITEKDNWYSVEQKVNQVIDETLVNDLAAYLNGAIQPHKQDGGEETFTGKYMAYRLIESDKESLLDIINKVGLYPYLEPGLYCFIELFGKKIFIKKVKKTLPEKYNSNRCYVVKNMSLVMKVKDGFLTVRLFRDVNFKQSLYILFCSSLNKLY